MPRSSRRRLLILALSGLTAAMAMGQGEPPALPTEFGLAYEETRPNGARLEFTVKPDGKISYRLEQPVAADTFVAEGVLEIKPALAIRLAGALRGEFSEEYSEGLTIPSFWTMAEGGAAPAPVHRLVIRAHEQARERSVTIPWSRVATAADNQDRDLPLSYFRLRLLQISGVAGAIARAFRERGGAIMRASEAKLKQLDPTVLEKKLQEGLSEQEEESYAMAQMWFNQGVDALDRTYNMDGAAEDDSEQVMRIRYASAFEAKHFRLAAQVVGMVLRDRLAWYDATLDRCAGKTDTGRKEDK